MPLNDENICRGCAPDPLTPGQVRGVPEGGCRADVWMNLGHFATAEEAALCVVRSPEGQAAAAERAAAAQPLTSEEARQQWRDGGVVGMESLCNGALAAPRAMPA